MTDEEALKEIDQQEKRFAAAGCGLVRGGGTESLGTITTIRHNMGPCCWPTGMVITIR